MSSITVSIVEDIPEIRDGLRLLIDQTGGFTCRGAYDDAETALAGLAAEPPDIAIMDIALPGASGIDCIRQLKARGYGTQFLVFTIYEDSDQVFEALAAGANGYLLKSAPPEKIMESLRELHGGGAPMSASIARKVVGPFRQPSSHMEQLSPRETEVLALLSKGLLYKEVADRLFISTGTVRQHIHHIYEKMHVQNRTEALNKYYGKRP